MQGVKLIKGYRPIHTPVKQAYQAFGQAAGALLHVFRTDGHFCTNTCECAPLYLTAMLVFFIAFFIAPNL